MNLACPTCSQVIDTDSLCRHREPICDACCSNGEHGYYLDGEESAA